MFRMFTFHQQKKRRRVSSAQLSSCWRIFYYYYLLWLLPLLHSHTHEPYHRTLVPFALNALSTFFRILLTLIHMPNQSLQYCDRVLFSFESALLYNIYMCAISNFLFPHTLHTETKNQTPRYKCNAIYPKLPNLYGYFIPFSRPHIIILAIIMLQFLLVLF